MRVRELGLHTPHTAHLKLPRLRDTPIEAPLTPKGEHHKANHPRPPTSRPPKLRSCRESYRPQHHTTAPYIPFWPFQHRPQFASMASNPLPHPTPDTPTTSYVDPTFSLINTSCLDLLLIELVPMAYRITADLAAREEEWTKDSSTTKANRLSGASNDASTGGNGGAVGAGTVDEEEAREAVFHRLEGLGYRVGLGIVERYVHPLLFPTIPRHIHIY
jgi:hypothetical protein